MNYHARNRVDPESAYFGFEVREVAFMRSMSEAELAEWMDTLREIRALPKSSPTAPCPMPSEAERRWAQAWEDDTEGMGS